MNENNNILGCYASLTQASLDSNKKTQDLLSDQGDLFRKYLWDSNGISNKLKSLINTNYGIDLKLGLFEFYVNPIPSMENALKPIGAYRKSEKSIGMPIIINGENFFSKSEGERIQFLKDSILKKMDLLEEVVKKKKLDTNMSLLKADLETVLDEWNP
jgi:hypothetical protein